MFSPSCPRKRVSIRRPPVRRRVASVALHRSPAPPAASCPPLSCTVRAPTPVILSGARQRGAEESRKQVGTASGLRHSLCPWGGPLDSSAALGMTGALKVDAGPMDTRFRGYEVKGRV